MLVSKRLSPQTFTNIRPGIRAQPLPSCGARDSRAGKHSSGGFLCGQTLKTGTGRGAGSGESQSRSKSQEALSEQPKIKS